MKQHSIFVLTLKCQENLHLKMSSIYVVCWIFLQIFQTSFCIQANSVDPYQTAPRGAVWSGSTQFPKKTLKNHKQMTKQTTIVVIGGLRVKAARYTSCRFSAICNKGDTFCDFLYVSCSTPPHSEKRSTLHGKTAPTGSNFFSCIVDHLSGRWQLTKLSTLNPCC